MNQKIALVFAFIFIALLCITGCEKTASHEIISQESCLSSQYSENDSMLEEDSVDSIIYILSISMSAHLVDRYTLVEDGELNKSSLAFDNDCQYFNNQNQSIDFEEFARQVNENSHNQPVKCKISTTHNNISKAYIID